ncbi:MAG TPA: GH3 auxin-responsive promoter family protein [Thermoanaerobaculia bacterium]|nr:GH3 auxin-responsive promoter family protein [Thermoanaerobaculia bacterium]
MNLTAAAANGGWVLSSLPEALAFRAGLHRVEEVQREVLLRIVRRNRDTEFGRQHDFASIRTVDDYLARVPVRTYEDFEPYIERQALTAEAVEHFEPTSGSSGAVKLIPYTRSLRAEVARAIATWVVSSFREKPRAFNGRAYWSLSPVGVGPRTTASGVRIGFDGDDEYVGRVRGALVRAVQAVPSKVRHLADIEAFRRETLSHLLRCRSLSMISVWHPSFLLLLLGDAQPDWPNLRVISCWTDAGAAPAAAELARRFPHVRIEPKGLLSTEGVVSIPIGAEAPALAYRSHFVELRPMDDHHEVILTTGGGLYRYATGDLVDIAGYRGNCPLLRFVGRMKVVDHFGEKLHELFVRERIERFVRAPFAMLALEGDHYTLFIDTDMPLDAQKLDEALRESFHYDYCRRLGQLGPVEVLRVEHGAYQRAMASEQKLGGIKPPAVDARRGWSERLTPRPAHPPSSSPRTSG